MPSKSSRGASAPRVSLRPGGRPSGHRIPTPSHVEDTATRTAFMSLGATTVICIYRKPQDSVALLREPDGTIARVVEGGWYGSAKVIAVEPDAVQLELGGRSVRLKLLA